MNVITLPPKILRHVTLKNHTPVIYNNIEEYLMLQEHWGTNDLYAIIDITNSIYSLIFQEELDK